MEQADTYNIDNAPTAEPIPETSLTFKADDGEYDWLKIARDAYETSGDYFDNNIRQQIEKNISMFHSRHPSGSKYHQESYKFRSKIFRPKTRSTIRRHEAASSIAFFSTSDIVNCEAEDKNNANDVAGAEFAKNLLNYRLEHSIDTFLTVVGAYQDAMTTGVVISRQEWLYETEEVDEEHKVIDPASGEALYNADGSPAIRSEKVKKVTVDKPSIDLIPIENFRFDTACDWRNPVDTSPYCIELMSMYAYEVRARMTGDNLKTGETAWYSYSDGEINSSRQTGGDDSTRNVREGNRQDSHDSSHEIKAFDIVWVHRNIVRLDGKDWLYYTLGTELLLSEPVPLKEAFLHGRPYAVGVVNIETHKNYSAGLPEMGQDLQIEANDTANQRLDNIKLILNKRYRAKRGSNVDWRALKSSVPGGVILMDNLTDIKEESFSDVTGSSYAEQDRINLDYDELMGGFSNGSVATNRSMNETVGGMSMAKDDSNMVTEYQLRVFTESWFERVLRQLLEMERLYETDQRVLGIAGKGVDPEVVAQLMQGNISTKVDVGYGATAPHKRIEKIAMGLDTVVRYMPHKMQQLNEEQITKEVFGALGFRDGSRFFKSEEDEDPQVTQLKQQLQQMQQQIQMDQAKEQVKQQGAMQLEQLKQQGATQRDQMKQQLEYIKLQIAAETNEHRLGELQLEEKALLFKMKSEEVAILKGERDKLNERISTIDGDGLVDDKGSTVMTNDQYGMVPMAEG
jgi:hypothetical protein